MAQPRVIKNFNLFIGGLGYAGLVKDATLPDIKVKTESYRNGGMDMEKKIDMGLDAMSMKFTMTEWIPAVMTQVALGDTEGTVIILRAAKQANNEIASAVVIEAHGALNSLSRANAEAGKVSEATYEMDLGYYKETVDGVTVFEIDPDNCVRIIGGVDVMASIRSAIGS